MTFEVYRPQHHALSAKATVPRISIGRFRIQLNPAAWDMLGRAEYVLLGFDPKRRILGIQATAASNPQALRCAPNAGNPNYRGISGTGFRERYNVPPGQRFEPELRAGWLTCGPVDERLPGVDPEDENPYLRRPE